MEIPFPDPTAIIAGRNFWAKGNVRRWRAAIAGEPAPVPQPDDEVLINSRQVRELFGGVSDMWLWRRRQRKSALQEAADAPAA